MDGPSCRFTIADIIRRVILSWLTAVLVEYLLLPADVKTLAELTGLAQTSLMNVIILTIAGVAVLCLLAANKDTTRHERCAIAAVAALLSAATLKSSFTWPYLFACLLVTATAVGYAIWGWNKNAAPAPAPEVNTKMPLWITLGLGAVFFLFVCAWTVGRIYSFCTPTYDFGIFSQMFYNMTQSGLPMTTVERDGLLSHFAVHVSPIYYLMLPVYWLFPKPATLQVLQALVISSSVIPLWLLSKRHGLSSWLRLITCAMLLLLPAFSGGTSYDIHENCFLTPLILWLLYAIDTKKSWLIFLSAFLVLMVKEDAAVYVAVIALWLILRACLHNKPTELLTGVLLMVISLIWFSAVTGYLAESGDGVMTYRYQNFMYDGSSSLVSVIIAVVMNPMKALYECVDPEKLRYIWLTLLPLLGLPLVTRRYERLILLIPFVLVNLMSDYQYQHDIFFQYSFGSIACLMYLVVVNLADFKLDPHRLAAGIAAVAIGIGCFSSVVIPKATYYPNACIEYFDYYQNMRDALALIPEDASVAATTFFTTELSQREVLYDVRYCSREHLLETEYVALKLSATDYNKYATGGQDNGLENLRALLEANGYTLWHEVNGVMVIYHRAVG